MIRVLFKTAASLEKSRVGKHDDNVYTINVRHYKVQLLM